MLLNPKYSWRRAVGLLWFACVSVPMLFFSAGISVDLTRIIVSKREASNLAAAAALAGAFQFAPGQPYLDPFKARQVAEGTWDQGRRNGTDNAARMVQRGESRAVTFDDDLQPTQVRMTIDYRVSDLLFVKYFLGNGNYDYQVSRTAFVCVPGQVEDPTEGYCVRPQ